MNQGTVLPEFWALWAWVSAGGPEARVLAERHATHAEAEREAVEAFAGGGPTFR